MNFPQEKLIGSNEFDLGSLGGCTEKPVEVELKNKTDSGEDQPVGKLNLTISIGKSGLKQRRFQPMRALKRKWANQKAR